jgi:hypothetical protein
MEGLETNVREVITSLKEGKPVDKQWLIVGSPVVPGGKVTSEFVDQMRNGNAFQVLAKLKSEMAMQELDDPNTKLIMTGHSYGADMAITTARAVEQDHPELADRVRVLADDPVRGEKAVKGAVLAGLSEAWKRRKDMVAKMWITSEYKRVLTKKSLNIEDTPEQARVKKEALTIMDRDFKSGNDFFREEDAFPDKIQTYVRQGAFDETDPSIEREEDWGKFLEQEADLASEINYYKPGEKHDDTRPISMRVLYHKKPNVRVWGYGGRHAIDRFRHAKRFVRTGELLEGKS